MPDKNNDHSYLDEEEVQNAKYSLEAWADKHNVCQHTEKTCQHKEKK